MGEPVGVASAGTAVASAGETAPNAYQLTLQGLVLPIPAHLAFNAIGAVCVLLLGHPVIASIGFLTASTFDIVQQTLLRRWIARSDRVAETAGLRRLALLCATRVIVYLAPALPMVVIGGRGELFLVAFQICGMVAVAHGAGALSRLIYWAFVGPALLVATALAAVLLPPIQALGVWLSLASMALVLLIISSATTRSIRTWSDAFYANLDLVRELAAARDEARRAHRAKSNFLATMSHEIRTPMNGVLGMAQLLRRDERDLKQAQRIDTLIDSGKYLMSILNDVLDVSKIDAGHLEIVPASEDLQLFLDRLVGFWGGKAQEKAVRLGLQAAEGLPEYVMIDSLRLRQVLFNLLGNALKFTEAGAVDVLAVSRPRDGESVWLQISVRDTGPGIRPEHLPVLFDRFTQADESEARRFGGTGLGLAIAKQLTELMGGRIWVDSVVGRGSTFHVEIPAEIAARPATAEREATELAPSAELTVLAVDDNAVNLQVLEQLLGSFGHVVVRASSGAESLEMMAHQTFDLVLMDIQMPGMTGIEALQRLRAEDGPNRYVPVVALTADVTSGGRQRYLDLGFTDHATKPIQIEELFGVLSNALAQATDPVDEIFAA